MDKEAISSKKWSILGGILALSSSIVYTFYGLLIKEFNLDFVDNMVVRSVLQIPLVVIFVKLRGKNILLEFPEHATKREKVKKYMVLIGAGILTGLNMMCTYLGVLYIPLGDAMTIIYTAPIFTMVFSSIFLRIRQGIWKIFFALILMIGVILVIRPPFLFPHHLENLQLRSTNQTLMVEFITKDDQNIYWIGVAICIGAAACTGLMNVVFNYLKDVDSGVMMFWSGLTSILCSFVFLCFDQNSQIFFKHNIDWILLGHLSALAVVGISAFWMVTLSRQLIDPTLNSVLLAQEVIFAYVAQTIGNAIIQFKISPLEGNHLKIS